MYMVNVFLVDEICVVEVAGSTGELEEKKKVEIRLGGIIDEKLKQ